MSRVRVYELAKEAGMSSKALTDKLIELGFDIKGHSSAVDDETAEKIRNTVLTSANTELVEKRIDSDTEGSTVIRRRATVIRRRAQVKEETEPEVEDVQDVVAEDAADDQVEDVSVPPVAEELVETVSAAQEIEPPAGETISLEQGDSVKEDISQEVLKKEAPQKEVIAEEVKATSEKVVAPTAEKDETSEVEVVETKVQTVKAAKPSKNKEKDTASSHKKDKQAVQGQKRPMARVIRTIELPKTEEPKKPSRPPQRSQGKPPISRKPANASPAAAVVPGMVQTDDSNRTRKKGKKTGPDLEERGKDARRGKKGQKNVKFTHFAQEQLGREGGPKEKRAKS